ncbi:ABC transporter permease [Microbacterium xanthum]|uniref:ABC transporter permease n=1 Tax=Microbacterium xanthum TaxID=3079794 RepID=UPI002AD55D0F|nr:MULTISPECIES: ABC transporter permease [unclassified Microbacterium]MDZ8171042.1 ABC transporter permease [Microbacterium sp. KSW-48]MDZ8201559.1 ABC transporter permease [Microbacterium sp. SSW1-59]
MSVGTRLDVSEYDVPGRGRGLLDVFQWRYLLRLLVRKGTATRYRNSVLGWVWSYVKPASQFLIYYFVMGIILQFHRDVQNFAIYLFAGVVVVNLFNEAFGNATNAIVDNRALVKKIYLPRELFPIAAIIVAFVHFLPQLVILLLVCLLVGWTPTLLGLGGALLGILLVVAFALGLGLFFSGLNVRFRDAQNFVDLIKMFSTWTSPVLYTWALVADALRGHDWLLFLYMSNPLTVAVELFHVGFWEPTTTQSYVLPEWFGYASLVAVGVTLIALVAGQWTFRRFERTFAQDL